MAVFDAVKKAPAKDKYPHAARWYAHILSFEASGRKQFPKSQVNPLNSVSNFLLHKIMTYVIRITILYLIFLNRRLLNLISPLPEEPRLMMMTTMTLIFLAQTMKKKMPKLPKLEKNVWLLMQVNNLLTYLFFGSLFIKYRVNWCILH